MKAYGILHRVLSFLALSVLLLAILGCGAEPPTTSAVAGTEATRPTAASAEPTGTPASTAEPTDEPTPLPTEVPTAEPTVEPTEAPTTEPSPLYLGDVAEGYGCILLALSVEDPTTPGMLYTPLEGTKLVGVEIVVANGSSDPLSVNPLSTTLLDSEGFVYEPELGGRNGQIATIQLEQGEKVRGWVAFEVPETAVPTGIRFATGIFGDDAVTVSLVPAPDGYVPDRKALSMRPSVPEVGLGEVCEEQGYSLSATSVEDPATPGMLYKPIEGHRLVAVEMIVGNVSGDELSVNPLYTILVDTDGFVYEAELGGRDGQLATLDLGAGEKVKGWVAYTVPENATPASVKFSLGVFSDEWLQVRISD